MHKAILIIDDMPQYLERQKEFLRYSKVNVLIAANVSDALKTTHGTKPDIVFMDMNIPVKDELDFCHAIKSNPNLSDTPIIMTSTLNESKAQECILLSYCDAMIDKPQNIKQYLNIARHYVSDIERRNKRIACSIDVVIGFEGITSKGQLDNISIEGAHISTEANLLPDDIIRLAFVIPDGTKIDCYGRIICVYRSSPKTSKGFGVKFALTNSTVKDAMTKYIEAA
jgi:CheY-like chemotaxis protein